MRTADLGQQDVLIIYIAVVKYLKEMKEERVILANDFSGFSLCSFGPECFRQVSVTAVSSAAHFMANLEAERASQELVGDISVMPYEDPVTYFF